MILFFGPPGSGKSVQGKLLVERNHWAWLSTGELFRRSTDPAIIETLVSGNLVDDESTNNVLAEALSQIPAGTQLVLDGYPRNFDQAKWLDGHLSDYGISIQTIIVFEVPHEELMKRLLGRGRAEDAQGVIEKRLDIYRDRMAPVMEFYKDHHIPMCSIDGLGNINIVHQRMQTAVETCLHV